jgi:hypothetical protein
MKSPLALMFATIAATAVLSSCSGTDQEILDEPDRAVASAGAVPASDPLSEFTSEQVDAYAKAGIQVSPTGLLWAEDCSALRNAHLSPTAQAHC